MTLLAESEALHQRVRAFMARPDEDSFSRIALDIARYQAKYCAGFARLVAAHGGLGEEVDGIPAVPTDAFRLTRVATHAPELDSVRFATSGTTSLERGVHPLRTTQTYAEGALAFGRRALTTSRAPCTVVAIAPALDEPVSSSLGFMMQLFMSAWDGRGLDGGAFAARSPERWLLRAEGVDLVGLRQAIEVAEARAEPLLILSTSFAWVALLDALDGKALPLPQGSAVMQTGGYKGRVREVPPAELRKNIANTLRIPENAVVSEYGMTELSSQLYEGTLARAELRGKAGIYLEPPWLRVTPVEPVSLRPVPDGEIGLARFVDLANVDSAVAIVTRDLVRRRDAGIELVGREAGAPARGCSLAIEALLAGAALGR